MVTRMSLKSNQKSVTQNSPSDWHPNKSNRTSRLPIKMTIGNVIQQGQVGCHPKWSARMSFNKDK